MNNFFPSIHELFVQFNSELFSSKLDAVSVEWSSRMTLSAGLCTYHRGTRSCRIKLSECLLQYRPVEDLVDTLLHEMIHAYLFVTENNVDRDGHGPNFQQWMNEINGRVGSRITIFHSFHDEVNFYRTHVWKCDGPCRYRPPYFGFVKRSMNRPPQPADIWYAEHESSCGGKFYKISEPSKNQQLQKEKSKKRKKKEEEDTVHGEDLALIIRKWGSVGNILGSSKVNTINHAPVSFTKEDSGKLVTTTITSFFPVANPSGKQKGLNNDPTTSLEIIDLT